jgi:hypothetical protein
MHMSSKPDSTVKGRRTTQDKFIEDFPYFGGRPGKHAAGFVAIWVALLCLMVALIIISFASGDICLGIGLIILTAIIGTLPAIFLIGSRI